MHLAPCTPLLRAPQAVQTLRGSQGQLPVPTLLTLVTLGCPALRPSSLEPPSSPHFSKGLGRGVPAEPQATESASSGVCLGFDTACYVAWPPASMSPTGLHRPLGSLGFHSAHPGLLGVGGAEWPACLCLTFYFHIHIFFFLIR